MPFGGNHEVLHDGFSLFKGVQVGGDPVLGHSRPQGRHDRVADRAIPAADGSAASLGQARMGAF